MVYDRHSARVIKSPKWPGLRRSIIHRDEHRCVKCGSMRRLQVDHVLPVRTHPERAFDPANLQTLCRACHSAKTRIEIGLGPLNPKREAWKQLLRGQTPTIEQGENDA